MLLKLKQEEFSFTSYPNFNPNLFTVPGQLTPRRISGQYFNPDMETFGKEFIKEWD